ncbi:MAG: DnaA regulatory inactivator Hda [Rhodoferax sp.]|nr:DnaA regulatory inactivator Hda [Rhodoferax sp.]NCP81446.1 DnaA regulatory inactivator Hda [Rhodoferax sp.]PIZ22346.1 MAG: DnaA regulatory inactivator Hda [Comamonadaceae bacterium CG_4_10_14_0_8_um_filter_57_29]
MQQLVLDMGLPTGPTLANFCAGPNAAALAHLKLWLGEGSHALRSPVPTYLWGGSGCGKTHLLKALRAALQQQGDTVGWLDASVQMPPEFDERWACVLLDDVQAFDAGQQHAAFNWFVNAQTHQMAVIAAGSLPPADLKLRDDLRTRLGWGTVFALQALSEPERRAVLHQAAEVRGIALSDEVMDFMLTRFSRDLGSLMELLDLMDGYALQTQRAITIPLIKTMMDNT